MVASSAVTSTISTTLTQVSCGSGTNVWGVDAAHNIYQFQSSDGGHTWTQTHIPGGLQQVSVAADGTVWGVNSAGAIYQYNGSGWTTIAGTLAQVSVGSASLIWGVNSAGTIYRYNGSGWTTIAGALKQVSVASDGTVWGVNPAGIAYQYVNNTWVSTPGHGQGAGNTTDYANGNGTFTLVAVMQANSVYSSIYALDPSDPNVHLYSYVGGTNAPYAWLPEQKYGNTLTYCSVASDGTIGIIDQGMTTITVFPPS
ncbi:MAG TPA: tectonin domain-containing protein [Ktedonobacteraceae bacterium]|nr:tectonin domain-containing protein [Ktedonobacteraceae bacterium]